MQSTSSPTASHNKAAEAHQAAAKIHQSAAACHDKGDHKAGLAESEKASEATGTAQKCCTGAHADSKAAVH
jgi:hypothetical protein